MSHDPYEDPAILDEYLLFHYGGPLLNRPWDCLPEEALEYPRRSVAETFDWSDATPGRRALDIGCAVGRSTFEFARFGANAHGIDFSGSFIRAAETIRTTGCCSFRVKVQGRLRMDGKALLPDGVDPARVTFQQGDAHEIGAMGLGAFDYVLAGNLLCRLSHPRRFLDQLPNCVVPGGQLVILSPCTWLEAYTAPEEWVGGGDEGLTETVLPDLLKPHFELEWSGDLPFIIREHARKFQFTVAAGFRFRRR